MLYQQKRRFIRCLLLDVWDGLVKVGARMCFPIGYHLSKATAAITEARRPSAHSSGLEDGLSAVQATLAQTVRGGELFASYSREETAVSHLHCARALRRLWAKPDVSIAGGLRS